jgi:hypothetical protein
MSNKKRLQLADRISKRIENYNTLKKAGDKLNRELSKV